jgi:hypothetical protein
MNSTLRLTLEVVVVLALAGAAVVGHRSETVVLHFLGSFCGLFSLSWLVHLLLRHHRAAADTTWSERVRRYLPPLVVVGVAMAVLAPLLAGQMPLSHDHPVHLYKAWHFWEEMLLDGRLRGWSSYWFFGYPAEELYPIGPDLWVALFRLVTLGLASWETTYGLAFVGVFALAAYAVYSFGRRFFGPAAGVVAGLLWILDRGDYREGGWSYTVDWAVWVQILAMAFALLALGRLQDALDRGKPRDYAIAGALFAAALLSHPMNVIVFGVGIPLYLLTRWLGAGKPIGREIAITAAVAAIGVALAGFWFLPMMARSGWTTSIGDLWRPLSQTSKALLDGSVFANVWPLPVALGLIGAALGLAMKRWVAIFLLLLAAVMLFASTSTAFHELSLISIAKAFSKIQYQRLVIPAKACLYLLAGFAIAQLVDRVQAWREARKGTRPDWAKADAGPAGIPEVRAALLAALVCLILSPFVRPALEQLGSSYFRTIGSLVLKRSIHYWDDYQRFLTWSAKKRAESKTFYRISYELDRHNHLMMGAPAYNQTPYYKVGYTPAKLFKHVTETTEDPLYRALSVQYVVSQHPLSRPGLVQETRFGGIFVYRFSGYRPERYTLTGPGRVEVQTFEEEKIRLKITGAGSGSRLKVHVANYGRWRAELDGAALTIKEAPVHGTTSPMLMEVPVKDGVLEFDYVMRGVDVAGSLASLAGIAVVVLLVLAGRREALAARLREKLGWLGPLVVRYAGWAALAALILVAGAITHRLARGGTGMAEDSLSRLLPSAKVSQAGRPCTDQRGDAWFCSGRSWNYVGPTTNMFNGSFIPCIWAHPVDEGPLEIRIPRVTLGQALVGHHGLADGAVDGFAGGAPVQLEIAVNGQVVEKLVRPNQKGWVGFRVDTSSHAGRQAELKLTISTARAGGRHYCFDARIERR